MEEVAKNLSFLTERMVVNRTGLSGLYDFEIRFTPENRDGSRQTLPGEPLPSIFTAMLEQLGLRLSADRLPIEVLVIDRIDRPTEN